MKKSFIPIIIFLLLGLIFPSCALNPVTGKKEFSLMSHKQELALGQQSDPSIIASFGLYEDEALQKFINDKGTAMAKISHRSDLEFKFRILDSPVVNAFAVPGGYVYFTRGILAHFNNEAEFAGVLGHEIGHITARHSAKQYTKATIAQVGLFAGMILSEDFRKYADAANTGLQLLFLKFGRDHESQSDRLGVEYSTKVGYDAHEMANFFKTLDRVSGGSEGRIPEFMSTHPDPLNRFEKVEELATEWQTKEAGSNYKVNRDSYLRMIDGLIYGDDPRQGYVENFQFYHPELKFQYKVPNGWKTVNSPQQVQMAPEDGKALMILTLGQGQSLEESAEKFVTENQLTLADAQKIQVNGLPALRIISDQIPQQQQYQQAAPQTSVAKDQTQSVPASGSTTSGGDGSTSTDKKAKPGTVQTQPSSGSDGKTSKSTTPSSPAGSSPASQAQPTGGVTPTLRVMTTLIEYNGLIYMIHGLSKFEDFNQYTNLFAQTMNSFTTLSDPAKINKKPERIFIKTVARDGSLQTALKSFGMKDDQLETLALLNGMQLNDQVKKGALVKVLGE